MSRVDGLCTNRCDLGKEHWGRPCEFGSRRVNTTVEVEEVSEDGENWRLVARWTTTAEQVPSGLGLPRTVTRTDAEQLADVDVRDYRHVRRRIVPQ